MSYLHNYKIILPDLHFPDDVPGDRDVIDLTVHVNGSVIGFYLLALIV